MPDGTVVVTKRVALPDWRPAAWFLERRIPERWGRRDVVASVNIDGDDNGAERDEKLSTARDRLTQALLRIGGDTSRGDTSRGDVEDDGDE